MEINRNHNRLPFLFLSVGLIGLFLVLSGVYLQQRFTFAHGGGLIFFVCIMVLGWMNTKEKMEFSSQSLKARGFIVFSVILWITLILLIGILSHRYDIRWDLTQHKSHTLSSATQELISELDEEVKITIFYAGFAPRYLTDLLKSYERLNTNFKTEIVDPIVDIGYAAQFNTTISSEDKLLIVQSAGERKDVTFTDRLLTENDLNNAIVQVSRDQKLACFITGHNESRISLTVDQGLSIFSDLLKANNILSKEILISPDLLTIDSSCDVIVVAGPKSHYTEHDIKLIQTFLDEGGDGLFLIEHTLVTTPDLPLTAEQLKLNPSLNEILGYWGINVRSDVVVDLHSNAGDVGSPATRNYLKHRAIVGGLDYTFFVRPRSIESLKHKRASIKTAPLILTQSNPGSWGETNRNLMVKFDEGSDLAGPVPLAYVIWEPKLANEVSDTRIIVITDVDFLTNIYIGQYSNARLGLNAMQWLIESDYQVYVEEKDFEVPELNLTSHQKRQVIVLIMTIPLLIALISIGVWSARKCA